MKRKKLKIFRLMLKDFMIYGISGHEQNNPFIKLRTLLGFLVFCCAIISSGGYIYFEAKTFQEYANSIFLGTAVFAATAIYVCTVWKKRQLFNCFNELEQIIVDSELRFLHLIKNVCCNIGFRFRT